MKLFNRYSACGALAVLAVACASTPKEVDSIAAARSAISQVEHMPLAGEVAAKEIDEAHTALREAERLAEKRKSAREINNAAYLAKRHADIAAEQISIAQSKKQVADAERDRQRVLAAARAEEAQRSAQAAETAKRDAEAANRDAEAANRDAAAAAQQTEEAKRRIDLLQQELAELNAKKTDRGLVLTLGDVLFDTGQATLKPGALSAIDRLAKFMKESPEHGVMIEGHTDSVGTDAYNQDLSQRRADAVRSALTSRGVDGRHVTAVGKGEGYPVATNDNAGGRQQNRRVEIVIES